MITLKSDKKKIAKELFLVAIIFVIIFWLIFKDKINQPQTAEVVQFAESGELVTVNSTQDLSATSSLLLKLFATNDKLNTAFFDDYKFKSLKNTPNQQNPNVRTGKKDPFAPFNETK